MTTEGEFTPTLAEAALRFLSSLPSEGKREGQQEVNKFIRWYGEERPVSELSPHEVANFAESIGNSSTNPLLKLEHIKAFLAFVKKERLTSTNLAVHLRVKKNTPQKRVARRIHQQPTAFTPQGYAQLESELAALKGERPRLAEELRLAAADKDFRENAPLEAARETQGQLEARIRALEATLQTATVLSQEKDSMKMGLGCTAVLRDLASGEELRYTLVVPNEANLTEGKLSVNSPTGQALLDRKKGEVVEVTAPLGTLRYRIEEIKR